MMAEAEIRLVPDKPRVTTLGRIGVVNLNRGPGHPLTVDLAVLADEEHDFVLEIGDTFSVRDQTWKLDRVEDSRSDDWTVVLVKVPEFGD